MTRILSLLLTISAVFAQVDYTNDVQTIFTTNCTSCHTYGHNTGLDLTSYSTAMAGSNNGAVIVAGDHANSLLWQKINSEVMPPNGNLSSTDINTIANWIDEGALETPADPVNLFFSEYIEGSGNNKVLEIYNPTGSAVDLSGYTVQQSNNGAGWGMEDDPPGVEPGFTYQLSGTLEDGDVFILAANAAGAEILSLADVALAYPSVSHFTGDDAIGLFYNDNLIDVIGIPSEDPGSGWSVAGVSNATKDHTLVRKSAVVTGSTDWTISAGTSTDNSEWIVESQDYIENLGYHVYGTGGENMAPIANAGSDQTVAFESEVTLDGSASLDPDGSIESYSWEQVYGGAVTLSSNSEAIVTFTAPATGDSLSFILTVTDEEGATGSATVYVKTAQGVSSAVFFSEWAEGSSNNKYIEIYNGSDSDIDLSQYKLATCSNGCNTAGEWDYPDQVTFASGTILSVGDVYIIAHSQADPVILAEADYTGFQYLSNGDDVFGLVSASTGQIIDIVGEIGDDPGDGWDVAGITNATKDHTLVRKTSVTTGNADWASSAGTNTSDSEWVVYDQNTWDNLGSHSQNANAPSVAITGVGPEFVSDNTEIVVTAELNAVTGSISSATIKYGSDGSFLNTTDMWLESGSTWMGNVPAQNGNTFVQFKVVGIDDSGNEGESSPQGTLVASSTPNEIDDIHTNVVEGQIVTIQGIVTIGSGLLSATKTSAYIQDTSDRGLNLFDYDLIEGIDRGDELRLVGYVEQYNSTVEVIDFVFETLSAGNTPPAPASVTTSGANSSDWEGTYITMNGSITAIDSIGDDGTKLTLDDGSGPTYVMIWNSTGLNGFDYAVGSSMSFAGVGSKYYDDHQLLVAYTEDVSSLGLDDTGLVSNEFALHPAFPNPFNPRTTISFTTSFAGKVHLDIYDINGRIVAELQNEIVSAGTHQMQWDASSLSSGVYFIRLRTKGNHAIQKVMLLK
ncbi:MAG: T9SS type A sorting domain-containing protein [Candidatus Marinimicrobia bacterium]|nr:T9SS type A sorting domain-containing protein [Candidatus Neomarinimicrobiota bacterium]